MSIVVNYSYQKASPEEEKRIQEVGKHTDELRKYLNKIPLSQLTKMSLKKQFELAEKMMEDDKKNNN